MVENDMIKVLIVDDHRVVRNGLKAYIQAANDIDVVSELNNGETLLKLCEQLKPDVILMDIVMPGLDGLALTRAVREKHAGIHIVVITGFHTNLLIRAALEAGATGYLSKDASAEDVIQTIRAVRTGLTTLGAGALNIVLEKGGRSDSGGLERYAARLINELRNVFLQAGHEEDASLAPAENQRAASGDVSEAAAEQRTFHFGALTFRESQIVKLVLMGYTSEEIARYLHRSPRTIQKHRANLMRKLGAHNQIDLTRLAYQFGVMPSEAESEQIVAEANKALGKQD